jgi:hypothetical protein
LKKEDLETAEMLRASVEKEIMPVRQQIDDDKNHILIKKILQGLTNVGIQKGALSKECSGPHPTAM